MKTNKMKKNENDPWELGFISLVKRKICYFRVFAMYERGKPFE